MAGKLLLVRRRLDGRLLVGFAALLGVAVLAAGLSRVTASRQPDIYVGTVKDPTTALPGSIGVGGLAGQQAFEAADIGGGAAATSAVRDEPGIRSPGAAGVARRPTGQRLLDPSGRPYGAPIPFNSKIPVPDGLVWVLLVGSDARPGEPALRSRADSIHLLAANPATGQATVIGIPRDSYVEIPGHGPGKINTALTLGGPELLAKTVNRFTGLPVQLWAVAGFEAFTRVVDEAGGVDVLVTQPMDDWDSGARFSPGWHHFDGNLALAYSRDRHDFADGDLTRTRNHGVLILATLAKLRAEVGDDAGLRRWAGIAFRHLSLDVEPDRLLQLLVVARRTDPAEVTNLVLQGRGGMAGGQSVVLLDAAAAARIADDVRPDAAIGPAKPPLTTSTTAPSTTTATSTTTTTTTDPGPPGPKG